MPDVQELEAQLAAVRDEELVDTLNQLASAYMQQPKGSKLDEYSVALELAHDYCEQALELSKSLEYLPGRAMAINNMAKEFYQHSAYPKAQEYFEEACRTYREVDDLVGVSETLNNLGIIYWHRCHYDRSLDALLNSLEIREKLHDRPGAASVMNNIGLVYANLDKYDLALDFYKKALIVKTELGQIEESAATLNNIGIACRKTGKLDDALKAYLHALKIKQKSGNERAIAISENNVGQVYLEMSDVEQAAEHYTYALERFTVLDDLRGVATTKLNLGVTHNQMQHFAQAKEMLNDALQLSKELHFNDLLTGIYLALSDLYHNHGDDGEALSYYKLYTQAKEMIYNEENSVRIAEVQTRFELQKKEQETELFRQRSVELQKRNLRILEQKEEVERLNKELQQANATKHRFLSILAHDLKGPLNVLLLSSDFILSNLDQFEKAKIRELVEKINLSAANLAQLVEDMLEWANSQNQAMQFSPEKIDLANLISDTFLLLRPNAEKKCVELIAHVDEEPHVVFADRNMVLTVLRNLVSNAIKYTKSGGSVGIRARSVGDKVEIAVIDTGIGIPQERITSLFQSTSVGSTLGTANEKGTGLGLIICREFVERNGGEIRVYSVVNKGSKFVFTLPRALEMEIIQKALSTQPKE